MYHYITAALTCVFTSTFSAELIAYHRLATGRLAECQTVARQSEPSISSSASSIKNHIVQSATVVVNLAAHTCDSPAVASLLFRPTTPELLSTQFDIIGHILSSWNPASARTSRTCLSTSLQASTLWFIISLDYKFSNFYHKNSQTPSCLCCWVLSLNRHTCCTLLCSSICSNASYFIRFSYVRRVLRETGIIFIFLTKQFQLHQNMFLTNLFSWRSR